MDTFAKAVVSVLKFLLSFFDMGGAPDKYVEIGTASARNEKQVVPFARTDVPHLGADHDKLIKKAEQLFRDDVTRFKWLMAICTVRQSKSGWILDPLSKSRPLHSSELTFRTI
jgi:hypothetical protein